MIDPYILIAILILEILIIWFFTRGMSAEEMKRRFLS
jgi:hypothetical protein